jgi:hypothetical protein
MHWRNDTVVDVKENLDIINSTDADHETLCEAFWEDGCYPDGAELVFPNIVPND